MLDSSFLAQLSSSKSSIEPFWLGLRKIGSSGVRVLALAAGINEGGHYFRYFSSCCLLVVVLPSKPQKGMS
jgi:hypothetical protein